MASTKSTSVLASVIAAVSCNPAVPAAANPPKAEPAPSAEAAPSGRHLELPADSAPATALVGGLAVSTDEQS